MDLPGNAMPRSRSSSHVDAASSNGIANDEWDRGCEEEEAGGAEFEELDDV